MTVGGSKKDFRGKDFYLGFVIYGHHVGSRKLGDSRTFVAPNNFIARAFDETKDTSASTIGKTWLELIEEAA